MDDDEIFRIASDAVAQVWCGLRPGDVEVWRELQPSQAGMDGDSWLDLSSRMVKQFNQLSGDHFPNLSISRDVRKRYLGKELGEFVVLIADAAGQMP